MPLIFEDADLEITAGDSTGADDGDAQLAISMRQEINNFILFNCGKDIAFGVGWVLFVKSACMNVMVPGKIGTRRIRSVNDRREGHPEFIKGAAWADAPPGSSIKLLQSLLKYSA